jgi:hypothetical protein
MMAQHWGRNMSSPNKGFSTKFSCALTLPFTTLIMISSFRREVDEICALLDCYATSSGHFLPSFRDNLSALSSGAQNPKGFGAQLFSIPSCASAVEIVPVLRSRSTTRRWWACPAMYTVSHVIIP